MKETFPENSLFLKEDKRKKRWAVPYHYEALNSRVENLVIDNSRAINNKKILDLGCHFGTFAYACIESDAKSVTGIDSEAALVEKAYELFKLHSVPEERYDFICGDIVDYLERVEEDSFDTILCLGIFYYIHDPVHLLSLMKRAASKYILLDTFTAYYGACISKEGVNIFNHTRPETFNLPLVMCPLTQADKIDYTLLKNFKKPGKRTLSMLSLPTIPALENFFDLLGLSYARLSWDKYVINDYGWEDFFRQDVKKSSHWADVYHTGLRISYLIEVK